MAAHDRVQAYLYVTPGKWHTVEQRFIDGERFLWVDDVLVREDPDR